MRERERKPGREEDRGTKKKRCTGETEERAESGGRGKRCRKKKDVRGRKERTWRVWKQRRVRGRNKRDIREEAKSVKVWTEGEVKKEM